MIKICGYMRLLPLSKMKNMNCFKFRSQLPFLWLANF